MPSNAQTSTLNSAMKHSPGTWRGRTVSQLQEQKIPKMWRVPGLGGKEMQRGAMEACRRSMLCTWQTWSKGLILSGFDIRSGARKLEVLRFGIMPKPQTDQTLRGQKTTSPGVCMG
jgi:hypothetical protein